MHVPAHPPAPEPVASGGGASGGGASGAARHRTGGHRRSGRRAAGARRWRLPAALLLAFGAGVPVAAPARADPAGYAVSVADDGRGRVSVAVDRVDGGAATGRIAGRLTAASAAGQWVGPVDLVRARGREPLVRRTPLGPGSWRVTVELSVPVRGRCTAAVTVPRPAPGSTRCVLGAPTPVADTRTAPRGLPVWVWATAAGLLAGAAAAYVTRPDRR